MTTEQTMLAIRVMQAYVDGKELQTMYGGVWCPINMPRWNWDNTEYRIKPTMYDLAGEMNQIERELNAANAEIQSLKYNIDRVMGMYTAKDNQICNLLNICRANGIEVSSQDLIHGKEAKL